MPAFCHPVAEPVSQQEFQSEAETQMPRWAFAPGAKLNTKFTVSVLPDLLALEVAFSLHSGMLAEFPLPGINHDPEFQPSPVTPNDAP